MALCQLEHAAMQQPRFELHLIRAPADAPPFSEEYQAELNLYSRQLGPHSQVGFAMDAVGAVGGGLGEFIFANGPALLTGAAAVAGAYVTGRAGRKVKLKFGSVEIEARNPEEVAALLKLAREHADASAQLDQAKPSAVATPPAPNAES